MNENHFEGDILNRSSKFCTNFHLFIKSEFQIEKELSISFFAPNLFYFDH